MSTQFIPTIAKEDYQAFRGILNKHLPDTYGEWVYRTEKRSADNVSKGNISDPIEVNPDEFIQFCATTGTTPDLQALDNFAYKIGAADKPN